MVDITVVPDATDLVPRDGLRTLFSGGGEFEILPDSGNARIGIIRTSDRISFKACRRRWGWSSHLRHNLGPRHGIGPLWFGTGVHYALEDFHGHNIFGHPKDAFMGFVKASTKHAKHKLPTDHQELTQLGQNMMDYYIVWLQQRSHRHFKTLHVNGVPQVEVNFRFKIPGDWTRYGYDEVYYSGTIDRVCVDEFGNLWPLDYKTAKTIETVHYLTDPQINVYMWAMPHIYSAHTSGFLYMQLKKSVPEGGRILQNGGVSVAQNQSTTQWLYQETLKQVYGQDPAGWPPENKKFMRELGMREDDLKDAFIQVDKVERNVQMGQSEGVKILMEVEDMLNPDLALYPNPTRFCVNTWNPENSCPFLSACRSLDDGGDWLHELMQTTEPRESRYDGWRQFITLPQAAVEEEQWNRDFLSDIAPSPEV